MKDVIMVNGRPFDEVYPDDGYYSDRTNPQKDWLRGSKRIAEGIYKFFNPKSVIDMGCCVGGEIYYLKQMGVLVKGLDASSFAIKYALVPEVEQWDLRVPYPFKMKYDVCLCLETLEHIRQEYEPIVFGNLTNASDIVIMSSPEKTGGRHHVNEQPMSYWKERFREYNYKFDKELNKTFTKLLQKLKRPDTDGKWWIEPKVFERNKDEVAVLA